MQLVWQKRVLPGVELLALESRKNSRDTNENKKNNPSSDSSLQFFHYHVVLPPAHSQTKEESLEQCQGGSLQVEPVEDHLNMDQKVRSFCLPDLPTYQVLRDAVHACGFSILQ